MCTQCCSTFICVEIKLRSSEPWVTEVFLCNSSTDRFARERWVRTVILKLQSDTPTLRGEYFFILPCYFSSGFWLCSGPLNITESNLTHLGRCVYPLRMTHLYHGTCQNKHSDNLPLIGQNCKDLLSLSHWKASLEHSHIFSLDVVSLAVSI